MFEEQLGGHCGWREVNKGESDGKSGKYPGIKPCEGVGVLAGEEGDFGLCSQSCGKPLEGFQEASIVIWRIFYDRSLQLLCGKGTVEGECESREEEREGLFSISTG